jgi:hypothetical protein
LISRDINSPIDRIPVRVRVAESWGIRIGLFITASRWQHTRVERFNGSAMT